MEQDDRIKVSYSVYVRIGNNTLSISGDTEVFVKGMINEFKEPFFQSITSPFASATPKPKAKPPKGLPEEKEAEEPAPAKPKPAGGFRELVQRARPKTATERILLYMYYRKDRGSGLVKSQEIRKALVSAGEPLPSAFASAIGHLKEYGWAARESDGWKITSKGMEKIKHLIT